MMLKKIINHTRNRAYMSGIDRDNDRVFRSQEVFTPTEKVQYLLNDYTNELKELTQIFIDPACGDGQFLSEVLIRKIENGSTFEQALGTIYGVDLMEDNVELCRERLLCGREDLRHIVEQNIVCADGLRYHYRFDGSYPYDDEAKQQEFEERFGNLFEEQ